MPSVSPPQVIVTARGVPLSEASLSGLTEVRVSARLSLPTQCELTFADPPGPLGAAVGLTPGTALRVLIRGHETPLFDGDVTVVEHSYAPDGGRAVRVRAYDRLARLRKRHPTRAHVQVSLRELVEELVRDLDLRVQGENPPLLWRRVLQDGQSDFELLVDQAAQCACYLALRGDVLYLCTLEGIGPAVVLQWGESLLEARVEVSGEPAMRSVRAQGWDPLDVEAYQGQAFRPQVGRKVAAAVEPGVVGGTGRRTLTGGVVLNDRHAEALAQAELDRHVAREVVFWGVAAGNPTLRSGTPVDVTGLAAELNGRHVLVSVVHTVDARRGFLSELSSAPPAPAERRQDAVAALGIVSDVSDPRQLGRVRVTLPAFGDLETDWMSVLSAGAGPGKGVMIVPEAGDAVLVLLAGGDPGRGIVLGGLYGMRGMPDSGVASGAVRRFTVLTPGNQRVVLDDAERRIRLEDSQGSYVELSPQVVRIHAAVNLEIEAPGRSIVIRGDAVDFERG